MTEARLVINPEARILWRSPQAIQVELGTRGVVVDGIAPSEVATLLHNHQISSDVLPHPETGFGRIARHRIAQAREDLDAAGFMVAAATARQHRGPARLAPELAALRTRHGDQGADRLGARADRVVSIRGNGRLGALIGSILASSGVGHISFSGDGSAGLYNCVPGGITVAEEGQPYSEAAVVAMHRVAPDVDAQPRVGPSSIDLVVLAGDGLIDPDVSAELHQNNQAHLFAWIGGDRAIVGPTVVPGLSSCLRCADHHRLDRDEAWSALAAQLSLRPRYPLGSDVALATIAGGLAAVQSLAYLDGAQVTTIDATLELGPAEWRIGRRTWSSHPRCDCHSMPSADLTW